MKQVLVALFAVLLAVLIGYFAVWAPLAGEPMLRDTRDSRPRPVRDSNHNPRISAFQLSAGGACA